MKVQQRGYDAPEESGETETPEEEALENETPEQQSDSHFSSTYALKPNENYEVNGYSYETDRYGRITRCEGNLRLESGKRYLNHQVRAGGEYRLGTDVGGHLIADRFGGSGRVDNIVPMDARLNDGDYKKMENEWARELEKGNQVHVEIRCRYSGDSERPDSFMIKYKMTDQYGVDHYQTKRFRNEAGGE